ncbi:MAG: Gfo/Idh/MocA family protein [Candidatus Bipolaricaulia bacterium]
MANVKAAVIGLGFVGRVHCENLRRVPGVRLKAVATRNPEKLRYYQEAFGVSRTETDWRALLDAGVDVIHNCTPNSLHYEINRAFIEAGVDVISEKPLTLTVAEAEALVELANENRVTHAVCFNYRFFPVVQEMRARIMSGEIGEVRAIHGGYIQDWLLYETDYNWRLEPGEGNTRAVADIGSHWIDLARFLSGKEVARVVSDLATFIPQRKKPRGERETFARGREAEAYEPVKIETEDWAAILFEMEGGIRGSLIVSQVAPGRKNRLHIEVDGSRRSLFWDLEQPNYLWIGERDEANRVLIDDPALLTTQAYSLYPGGHNEGWGDAQKNLLASIYRSIGDGSEASDFPTFTDGLAAMRFEEVVLSSANERRWIELT